MKILIAEDDAVSRFVLEATLRSWGYEVIVSCDGLQALSVMEGEEAPGLAILDWMMPGTDGVSVIKILREKVTQTPPYIILLTAKTEKQDIIRALETGADDYLTKPFDREELRVRVQAGARVAVLQKSLADRISELEVALANVKQLQGILPICSYCKKIRDDQNYWQRVENYITEHSDAHFSHSVCPECYQGVVRPELDKFRALESNAAPKG